MAGLAGSALPSPAPRRLGEGHSIIYSRVPSAYGPWAEEAETPDLCLTFWRGDRMRDS